MYVYIYSSQASCQNDKLVSIIKSAKKQNDKPKTIIMNFNYQNEVVSQKSERNHSHSSQEKVCDVTRTKTNIKNITIPLLSLLWSFVNYNPLFGMECEMREYININIMKGHTAFVTAVCCV